MLPNFYIVGAAKSGTTSLYNYLRVHPEVFMSSEKEPNFFSFREIDAQKLYYPKKNIRDEKNYKKLFEGADTEKAIGEASVSYLFYKQVPERIKGLTPNSKILIILRNPIERAFSHFLMDQRLGLVDLSFEDIVFKSADHPMIHLYYQQFIELGFYHDQVKRYFDVFREENVKVFLTEDLRNDLKKVILDVYDFLNIENKRLPDLERKHNVYRTPKNKVIKNLYALKKIRTFVKKVMPDRLALAIKNYTLVQDEKPELSESIQIHLDSLFHKDILLTSELINRDLTPWLK